MFSTEVERVGDWARFGAGGVPAGSARITSNLRPPFACSCARISVAGTYIELLSGDVPGWAIVVTILDMDVSLKYTHLLEIEFR